MSNLSFKSFLNEAETASTIPDAFATNLNIPFNIFKKAWKAVGPTPLSQVVVAGPNNTKTAVPITPVTIDLDCNLEDGDDNCKFATLKSVDMPNEFITINGKNYVVPKDKQKELKVLLKGGKKIDQTIFGNLIPALMQQTAQPSAAGAMGTPPGGPLL